MSYDLFFESGTRTIDRAAFEAFFRSRTWWQLKATERGVKAWYENQDTGTYFSFDWSDNRAAFNVNYFRSHVFGLEAAHEVTAFVRAFAPRLLDPQRGGMGEGPYSAERLISGWNACNELAYRDFRENHESNFVVMSRDQIERSWRWNHQRASTSYVMNDIERRDMFVPKISLAQSSKGLRTYVVWDTTFSILLPEVDDIRLPLPSGSTIVSCASLAPALASYKMRPASESLKLSGHTWQLGLDARVISFRKVPRALATLVDKHTVPFSADHRPLGWDEVHTREVES